MASYWTNWRRIRSRVAQHIAKIEACDVQLQANEDDSLDNSSENINDPYCYGTETGMTDRPLLVASLTNDGSRRNEEIDDTLEVCHSVGDDGSDFLLEDESLVSAEFIVENDTLAGGEFVDEDNTLVGRELVDEDDTLADQFCSDGVKSDSDEIDLDGFSGEEVTGNVQEQLASWAVENSVPCRKVSSENLQEQLALWALEHNVPHRTLSGLLKILQTVLPALPIDPRTLLGTKSSGLVSAKAGGSYYHFGIMPGVLGSLTGNQHLASEIDSISMQVNIDGLPLFKSSNMQFWPILGKLDQVNDPFIIGLYCGSGKPVSASEYLEQFTHDVVKMQAEGITYNNKHFSFKISAVVCDSPARAFVKNVKSHSGYAGCDNCTQHGIWNGKMTFPEVNAPVRTDAQFEEMVDEEHHIGPPTFQGTGIGMVSQFPPDYMHLVCLGVMRRLLLLWMKGPLRCRLGHRIVTSISEALTSLREYIPHEFARKPRKLADIDRWKATEFRQLLVYTGPLVLRDGLPEELYKNFLLLFVAMYLLLCPSLCTAYCDYAQELLKHFVEHFSALYGTDNLVYNVHSLIHLPDAVRRFGSLDNISAFPFENFLGELKKMIRKPNFPLQQILCRMSERKGFRAKQTQSSKHLRKEHHNGPVPQELMPCLQYGEARLKNFRVSISKGNNCFKIGKGVVLVQNILAHNREIYVVFQEFSVVENFFSYPCHSSDLGIHHVSGLGRERKSAPISAIVQKCVLLPDKGRFVVVPLLHHL